ncbi:recombinase family protein [Streptomyces sp. 21So2-11]|uniref:recombinase family protein n=1 Tax=Streptomyces sp. 21So2-11 TaxID=3144408 RepID=UPI003219C4DD
MTNDLVKKAHWGDLTGQNWGSLVRLSFEPGDESDPAEKKLSTTGRAASIPLSGRDIKSRDEQEKDNKGFVESRGGSYVYTYDEPDTSAWKRKRVRLPDGQMGYRVIRPVFEGALEDLKRGTAPNGKRLDGLIVYDIDRLTRDNRHLEDAIEVVESFRRPIIDITGTLDLLTDNGRAMARVIVSMSSKQSADTARRVARKHRALQNAGLPAGGNRPFGWQEDRRTLHPDESKVLRDAALRIIAGAPITAVVRQLNQKGVLTAKGKVWRTAGLKNALRNPRACGVRARGVRDVNPETGTENFRYEIVYDSDGQPVAGQWQPILSGEEWQALISAIGANKQPGNGHNTRKYLLTGTLRCGKAGCDAPLRGLRASLAQKKPDGFFFYHCSSSAAGGCGGVRIPGLETDNAVKILVFAKYEEEAARRNAVATSPPWARKEELVRVREDISDLKRARENRQVSAERYFAFLAEYEARERTLLAEQNRAFKRQLAAQGAPIDLASDWPDLTLIEKRAYIERLLTAVVVAPSLGRRRPVHERLTPHFRQRED